MVLGKLLVPTRQVFNVYDFRLADPRSKYVDGMFSSMGVMFTHTQSTI